VAEPEQTTTFVIHEDEKPLMKVDVLNTDQTIKVIYNEEEIIEKDD